jgi:hypothetical protein
MPQRVQDAAEKRRLKNNIAVLNQKFEQRMAEARTDQAEHDIDQEWTHAVENDHASLGILETRHILRLVTRWDVDIPADAWVSNDYENMRYLSQAAQAKLRREIKAAKRETIRWWIQVTVLPITGLVGATIGLISLLRAK